MASSLAEELSLITKTKRDEIIDQLSEDELLALEYDWEGFLAREDQKEPVGFWEIWLLLAGRGFGKTRTGAEWIRKRVENGAKRIALVAETQKDLEEVMIEGDSGILSVFPADQMPKYTKKPVRIEFQNGAIALGYNGTQPDQLRGPQFDTAWLDEIAKWRYARETWDQLQFGLRLGDDPRQIVTTTPRPIELVKSIVAGKEGVVHITKGSTLDNKANLSKTFIQKIQNKYAGTRLGRQEINAEILGDMQGALWRHELLDLYRVDKEPKDIERVLVSVDPAVSNTENSDEHGITVGGIKSGEGYLLEDASIKGSPFDWARKSISMYDKYGADGIVVEVNQGGDMVAQTLNSVRQGIKIIEVRASKGKHVRAEPVASLYEQGRIHHVGSFHELENQQVMMTSEGYQGNGSPDRLDSVVWLFTELFPDIIRPINVVPLPKFKIRSNI